MSRRDSILAKIRFIPSLPSLVAKMQVLLDDPDADFGELARAMEYDPGMTANLLRVANSASFGGRVRIMTVRDALVRLGMREVYHMVVGLSVSPLMRRPISGYNLPAGELWQHSVAVAIGARELARAIGVSPPEHVFTCGLLHDVGKLVLGGFVQVDTAAISELAFGQMLSFEEAERQALGIDHAEVAGVLLSRWGLPAPIVQVARWHHDPSRCGDDPFSADVVHGANTLALLAGMGTGDDGLHYRPRADALERLELNALVSETVIGRIVSGVRELRDMVG